MLQIDIVRLYKNKKCLVVDDYPDIRASIKRLLAKFGSEHVDTASKCEEAMEMCMKHRYDIILADFNLGEKKNGQQLLEEMRFRNLIKHSSLYLMITAETTRDKVYSAIENQPDAYIAKPFSPPYLQKRLDALLIARNELSAINEAADNEQYELAIELCEDKIALNDKYRTLCTKMLGNFMLRTKQYKEAIALYQDALKERQMVWAMIGLGKALMGVGMLDKSEEVFRSLLQQRSPCLEVHDCLAEVLNEKGNTFEAQAILEEAAELSPEAILRQIKLAAVCETNDDLERAEKAHKKVVKIGLHSCHEEPSNYFNYVSCLNKVVDSGSGFDKRRYEDANTTLKRVSKRFCGDAGVQVRTKYMQFETAKAAGKEDKAEEFLKSAEESLSKMEALEELPPEVILSRARALHANGESEKAKEVLTNLAEKYRDDEAVTNAIDNCLDEPVSQAGKAKMLEFNHEGKALFDAKDFKGAVDFFNKALRIFPNHVALNLNLAMALVREMVKTGTDSIYLSRCKRILIKLEYLEEDSQFYKLRENLKQQLEKWADKKA